MRPFRPLLALAALAAATPPAQEAQVFVEEDGVVVMEAESHPPVKGWTRQTEHAGFTGTCYLKAEGGQLMTFPVFITRPGRYTMNLHNRHDHPRRDLENDAFVRIDSGPYIKCFSSGSGWTWASTLEYSGDRKVPPEYELSAGLHKLEIKQRSENFKIDRIALFLSEGDAGKRARDLAHPETRGTPPAPPLDRVPKALAAWTAGQLGAAMKALETAGQDPDLAVSGQARAGLKALQGAVAGRRAAIEASKPADPLAAAEALAFFARTFLAGSPAAAEFNDEASRWRAEPAAKQELQARRLLAALEEQAAKIHQPGTVADPNFARMFARPLASIRQTLEALRKSFPDTGSRRRAERIAAGFGIDKS